MDRMRVLKMQIQNNSQFNNSQLGLKGRAFNMDERWLRGNDANIVDKAVERLNAMDFMKKAECDILIFQDGAEQGRLAVIAQKMSDYDSSNKPLFRRAERTSSSVISIITSARSVITEYNEKILPLHHNPKGFKAIIEDSSIPCVRAEAIPVAGEAPKHGKFYEFGKKVFDRLFT